MSAPQVIALPVVYQQLATTAAKALACPVPPGKWEFRAAKHCAHEAVTASDTDYATIAVKKSSTTLASVATTTSGSGDLSISECTALSNVAAVGASAVFDGDSNEPVIVDIAKAASGVSISGLVVVFLKKVAD